jgi:hypothetical protein
MLVQKMVQPLAGVGFGHTQSNAVQTVFYLGAGSRTRRQVQSRSRTGDPR